MSQQTTTLAELRSPKNDPAIHAGFDTAGGFELIQRTAKLFASSDIVPPQFKGNLPNCVIAVDMALRMGANPLMVTQNLYVVHGRPAWSAQFLIATFNQSGRFSALRYKFQGKEGQDEWGCRAIATELSTKEVLEGPLITIGLAKKEGWFGKSGSKWQTMPELMLRYRAAAWFIRAYSPEIAMGLRTAEEVQDTFDMEQGADGSYTVSVEDIRVAAPAAEPAPAEVVNPETGEVTQAEAEPEPAPEPKPEPAKPTAKAAAKPAEQPQQPIYGKFRCPKGTDKAPVWVTESNCASCDERNGCPQWGEEDF